MYITANRVIVLFLIKFPRSLISSQQLSEIPLVCTEESPTDDSVYLTSAAGRCAEVVTALRGLVATFCDGNNADSNKGCVAITKGTLPRACARARVVSMTILQFEFPITA